MIVSLKDSAGIGGNIYIDPQVTNIDATIIADGALMNGTKNGSNDMYSKVWYNQSAAIELQNPLVINGQLLTYNTRGGSLKNNTGNLVQADTSVDRCIVNKALTSCTDPTLETAAIQDLERFRVVMRVPDDTNNRCTLHVTGVSALNRPEILTRTGF